MADKAFYTIGVLLRQFDFSRHYKNLIGSVAAISAQLQGMNKSLLIKTPCIKKPESVGFPA